MLGILVPQFNNISYQNIELHKEIGISQYEIPLGAPSLKGEMIADL